jgi:DNA-binding IscR family transcriptional regulator
MRAVPRFQPRADGRLPQSHAGKIATATDVPIFSLRKSLGSLQLAGILRSQKGPAGGYRLARPQESTTLLEIIEAVEGPI